MAKTDSVTTTPPISTATPKPMTVTIGTEAFLSAWRRRTGNSASPLARAVGPQHLKHAGARDARDQCDVDECQRERRQDQALDEAAEAVGQALVALHRQPREVDSERVHQRVADDERGDGEAE